MTEQSPAEAIFFAALEKSTPAERAAYLDAACGDDRDLRHRVERLLAAHPQVGSFLESAAPPESAETASYQGPAEAVGAVIAGRYKLLEAVGEGGMGTVFMAQQTEPVKRLVALKVIKPGMDSKQVLARFDAERQALALMDHPNIAKVLDGGITEQGRPYFVMELVKGVPITRFCDDRKLTPRERLELFVPVCQAIQHAHHKGVIHRDIKPGNVLVALYDGCPVPKVIDFGVAKAAGPPLTDATLVTGFGAVIGTPEYMSPEQAELNQLDIDTRSDVYALGVLLYELLTGTTPVDRKRLGRAAVLEVLRVVREEEPPRPSTRLSTSEALPSIAAARRTEPVKLTRLVRGELGPDGEFVPWNEPTWEKKRQELAAIPAPRPDLPFPGYVATDRLHWLRSEYNAAANDVDKHRLAKELLRRAEANGDRVEAVRWRAKLDPKNNPPQPAPK